MLRLDRTMKLKKSSKIILVVGIFLIATYLFINNYLNATYSIKNGIVNYIYWEEITRVSVPMPEADAKTFHSFSTNSLFAKDAKNIYFENKIITEADYDTFRPLDKSEILAKSGTTAEYYSKFFSKDRQNIFYNDQLIKTAVTIDTESLVILEDSYHYARDKNNVYYLLRPFILGSRPDISSYWLVALEGVESKKFTLHKNSQQMLIGFDGKNYYWEDYLLPTSIKLDDLQILNHITKVLKDNNNVYCLPRDSNKFQIFSGVSPVNFKQDNSVFPERYEYDPEVTDAREYVVFTDGQKYYNSKCQQIEVRNR